MTGHWTHSPKPIVILAPMDGYTDRAFRRLVKRIEPRIVLFTEFLSATELAKKPKLADDWMDIETQDQPLVVQLYGKDASDFKVAARLAEDRGAAGIDLNMGCPARRIVAHQHGSALMKNIDLACELVAGVKSVVNIPVSVKTRLGWEHADDLVPFGLKLEAAGLDAMTVHGRTYAQKFSGNADWTEIYELKAALRIPVFGNGDVVDATSAQAMLGNLNGVMIGRAAVSDPYVLRAVAASLIDNIQLPQLQAIDQLGDWRYFATEMVRMGTPDAMARRFRKFLIHLVTLANRLDLRRDSTQVTSLNQILTIIDRIEESSAVSAPV